MMAPVEGQGRFQASFMGTMNDFSTEFSTPAPPSQVMHNTRIKRYPDGSADIIVGSRPFGGGSIAAEPRRYDRDAQRSPLPAATPEEAYAETERLGIQYDGWDTEAQERAAAANRARAQRRARVAVRDLGLCNEWAYFVTLTFDPGKVDSYDAAAVVRKLKSWLDNRVRRCGLRYVLVPEHHKSGRIHFHGFFNDALPVTDSGHKDAAGHTVYNLPKWTLGFSTAIGLYGDKAAAVGYCCKYVAKQQDKIGGRWYYSGGDLRRPEVEWTDTEWAEAAEAGEPFTVEGVSWTQFVRLWADAAFCNNVAKSEGTV